MSADDDLLSVEDAMEHWANLGLAHSDYLHLWHLLEAAVTNRDDPVPCVDLGPVDFDAVVAAMDRASVYLRAATDELCAVFREAKA